MSIITIALGIVLGYGLIKAAPHALAWFLGLFTVAHRGEVYWRRWCTPSRWPSSYWWTIALMSLFIWSFVLPHG
jgi:hypothetical protein